MPNCLEEKTMEQETKRTVYFKDVFFAIVYRWKWLLIATLAGALLLGGIQMLGSDREVTLDSVSLAPENQIKVEQLQDTLARMEHNIEAQSDYLDNSVFISLDPYNAYSAGIYLQVTPVGIDDAELYTHQMAALLRGYHAHLFAPDVLTQLGEEFNMEAAYLRELLSFDFSHESYLSITARGRDAQEAQALRDAIIRVTEGNQEAVAAALGAHTVHCIPFAIGPRIDTGLFDTQNAAHQKLITMKNTLVSAEAELDRLLPNGLRSGSMSPVLFALIGAVLGFCLVAAVAFVGHLASGKVYSARVLKDQTGLQILGCLPGKKRNPIDRWLRKLEGRAQQDAAQAVAANICNRTKELPGILLLGSYEEAFLQPLVKALESRGKQCSVCADPANSAPAMDAIDQCEAAILVATCGLTQYENAVWVKQTVQEYGKQLLGCVVIDG